MVAEQHASASVQSPARNAIRTGGIAVGILGLASAGILGSVAIINQMSAIDRHAADRTQYFAVASAATFGVGLAGFTVASVVSPPRRNDVKVGVTILPMGSYAWLGGSF